MDRYVSAGELVVLSSPIVEKAFIAKMLLLARTVKVSLDVSISMQSPTQRFSPT